MVRSSVLASLVLAAGCSVSLAQPALDGRLDASLYGAPKWVQTVRTSYGDNRPDLCTSVGNRVSFAINNVNAAGVSGGSGAADQTAAAAVTTGIEVRIPLSQLGNPTGPVRIAGFVNNGDCNYLSNQVIGGFTTPRGNLGGDMNGGFNGTASQINFSNETAAPGQQYVTVANGLPGCTSLPQLDGTLDASFYGSPLWVQNTQTGFGDSNLAQTTYANGSEIDAVYAKICFGDIGDGPQGYLFVMVTGNLETNFNRLNLFFDTGAAGGQNQLTANPSADGLGNMTGLTFDTGFAANYYMDFRCGGGPFGIYADFAKLNPAGGGGFIGGGGATTAIIGAGNNCPPDQVISTGSEMDALYSYVDRANNRLYMMVTGNLKAGDFMTFFFDANGNPAGDEGQNTLHGPGNLFGVDRPNPQIGIADGGAGSLNRCGFDGISPGLTFDTGFFADYYLNTHIENTNRQAADAAVIRTHGRAESPLSGNPLDYGSYTGADIPNLVSFDGTSFDQAIPATGIGGFPGSIQPQDGSMPNLLSHYPPRESARVLNAYIAANGGNLPPANNPDGTNPVWTDWLGVTAGGNPVAPAAAKPRAGLLRMRIDNRNIAGVTDTTGNGSQGNPEYGYELSISLDELGYNPRSRIRVSGFINNGSFTSVSNQVLGDPMSTSDLGDPRTINFAADPNTARKHYVVVASCVADYNGDGTVAVTDIFDFLNGWFAGNPAADINGGGLAVSDIFDFLNVWFAGPCIGG